MNPLPWKRCALVSLVVLGACSPSTPEPAKTASTRLVAGASRESESTARACTGHFAITRLKHALASAPAFVRSSELAWIIDADEELSALESAIDALQSSRSDDAQKLLARLRTERESRVAHRARLVAAGHALHETFENAERAIDAAAHCKDVDLRTADATKTPAMRSRACEDAVRLWATAEHALLRVEGSCAQIAAHLRELSFTGEVSTVRDTLAKALRAHADALHAYRALALESERVSNAKDQVELRDALGAAAMSCEGTLLGADRVVGVRAEPRKLTVSVRPRWNAPLQDLHAAGETFGSGFLVQWKRPNGALETRVITNRHVMGDATEADIVPGDSETETMKRGDPRAWKGVALETDPEDDIAILRIESGADASARGGLVFRTTPAKEEETVTAAGFPGLAGKPSYQVSRGAISNASYGKTQTGAGQTYLQHTAPIDPGNSGGPLLDSEGRLLGMNTWKALGRENVGFAIPSSRLLVAMLRSEERSQHSVRNAEARCNGLVGALSSPTPDLAAMSTLGISLYTKMAGSISSEGWKYRKLVKGSPSSPPEEASLRSFAEMRRRVENERGVSPYALCTDVRDLGDQRFSAKVRTRSGAIHEVILGPEHASLSVIEFK